MGGIVPTKLVLSEYGTRPPAKWCCLKKAD